MSGSIQLRPVTERDLDLFEEDLRSPQGTGPHQWFGFTSIRNLRRQFAETSLLSVDGGILSIVDGTEAVGRVEWFKASWGRPDTSSCWTISAGVRHEHRGRGIGTEAQRRLVDYLFRNTRAERIQAYTDVENGAERRALEKAGFSEEGILRCAQWRDGGWHDQVLYSIVRTEWTNGEMTGGEKAVPPSAEVAGKRAL